MPFQDIAGNARVHAVLRTALRRGRVPHALLFVGPGGVGKRATARVLAQALNCATGTDDACGVCDSCRLIVKVDEKTQRVGAHPDVLEYEIPPDKTTVTIDQMRELKSLAYLKPMVGRRRVFIIDDVETMADEAANSLLKVLEEPPLTTQIVLLSDNPARVLPTIRSRCQTLTFLPVSDEDVERALVGRGLDPAKARVLALVVRGNLERALDLDWEEIEAERRAAWGVFRGLTDGSDAAAFLRRFGFGRRKDLRDEIGPMLELLTAFGRDLALLAEGGDAALLFNPDYEAELKALSGAVGPEAALKIVGFLQDASSAFDRNVHLGVLSSALTARWRQAAESM